MADHRAIAVAVAVVVTVLAASRLENASTAQVIAVMALCLAIGLVLRASRR